jgi:hypothetical protein
MSHLDLILYVAFFILELLAALGVPNPPTRYQLGWAGLACYALTLVL